MIKRKSLSMKNKVDGLINFMDYRSIRYKGIYLFIVLLILIASIIALFPVIWVILSSFKDVQEFYSKEFILFPTSIELSKIYIVWNALNVGKYYINSLILVLGSVFCSIIFNGMLAYAISIIKPKGYKIIYVLVLLTLMVPPITNMYTLLKNIVKFDLLGSYIPLWLSYGANAFYFVMFKTHFDKLPKELFDAAKVDGVNKIQMFTKIVLPLSMPIIMVVAIFTVNAAWSDFLLPYLVLMPEPDKATLMVRIFSINQNRPEGITQDYIFMLLSLSIIPVVILFTIFQKQITSNQLSAGKE